MSDKQVNICVETVMMYVQATPQHLSRMTEANHENRQSKDSR
jgi:hypothetical protein